MEEETSLAAAQAEQADVSYTSATYADVEIPQYHLFFCCFIG